MVRLGPETLARVAAARQILKVAEFERNGRYSLKRGPEAYRQELGGLDKFFDYLTLLESNVVLDIGTGHGYAAGELAEELGEKGLVMKGTGLVTLPVIYRNLGRENYIETSAETLRGVPDNSVAGILSVYSITYSAAPSLVVDTIDRVLVKGGAIKAALRPTAEQYRDADSAAIFRDLDAKNGSVFKELFEAKGYQVDVYPSSYPEVHDVLRAIKPGFNSDVTVYDL